MHPTRCRFFCALTANSSSNHGSWNIVSCWVFRYTEATQGFQWCLQDIQLVMHTWNVRSCHIHRTIMSRCWLYLLLCSERHAAYSTNHMQAPSRGSSGHLAHMWLVMLSGSPFSTVTVSAPPWWQSKQLGMSILSRSCSYKMKVDRKGGTGDEAGSCLLRLLSRCLRVAFGNTCSTTSA